MADKTELRARLEFWKGALAELRKAYLALLDGGVKKYTIDDRSLTCFDLPELKREIEDAETKVDALESLLSGGTARKSVAVIPRDW